MLKQNIQKIYIDEDWVVQQYKHMEKNKSWDTMQTKEDELVAELELELYAGNHGVTVEALQLSGIDSVDGEEGGEPVAGVTANNAFDEPDSDNKDDDAHVDGDDGKDGNNMDSTDSELDILSSLA
jgi:hypothetical protein